MRRRCPSSRMRLRWRECKRRADDRVKGWPLVWHRKRDAASDVTDTPRRVAARRVHRVVLHRKLLVPVLFGLPEAVVSPATERERHDGTRYDKQWNDVKYTPTHGGGFRCRDCFRTGEYRRRRWQRWQRQS